LVLSCCISPRSPTKIWLNSSFLKIINFFLMLF
jgi:hypothetical protein